MAWEREMSLALFGLLPYCGIFTILPYRLHRTVIGKGDACRCGIHQSCSILPDNHNVLWHTWKLTRNVLFLIHKTVKANTYMQHWKGFRPNPKILYILQSIRLTDFREILWWMRPGPGTNRLYFGADPDQGPLSIFPLFKREERTDYSKSCEWMIIKFFVRVGLGTRNNKIRFWDWSCSIER